MKNTKLNEKEIVHVTTRLDEVVKISISWHWTKYIKKLEKRRVSLNGKFDLVVVQAHRDE
jgi:hypothetical protein